MAIIAQNDEAVVAAAVNVTDAFYTEDDVQIFASHAPGSWLVLFLFDCWIFLSSSFFSFC